MARVTDAPDDFDDSVALAARMGATRMDLEVLGVWSLSATMVRVELTGDALRTLTYVPGQDLMLTAAAGPPVERRRWTIRSLDRDRGVVVLDVVLHPDGGASQLHLAAAGDVVEAIGPRGKVHLVGDARVHHFLGDQSFLPAAFVLAEAVRRPARAAVTLTVPGPDDRPPLDAPACPGGPSGSTPRATTRRPGWRCWPRAAWVRTWTARSPTSAAR